MVKDLRNGNSIESLFGVTPRELVQLYDFEDNGKGIKIKIMTYNILAQLLVNPSRYPTSRTVLRWDKRSKMLIDELKKYDAHILCLQEVDTARVKPFWRIKLHELGYDIVVNTANKRKHGLLIAYKTENFTLEGSKSIDLMNCTDLEVPRASGSFSEALFCSLKLKESSAISRPNIIIGTTHFYYHPFGAYERSIQFYLFLKGLKEWQDTLDLPSSMCYLFLCGDYNTQPFDAPYSCIRSKPVSFDNLNEKQLSTSLHYLTDPDSLDRVKYHPNNSCYEPREEQLQLINMLEELHNSVPLRGISLYSLGYSLVDPENAGKDNKWNEPMVSNWAHTFQGLLDYIFFVLPWSSKCSELIESVANVAEYHKMRLLKLLKLPRPEELNLGLPQPRISPSDHLCLMAEVELL